MATWGQFGFQDSCSPLMEEFSYFNDHAMVTLTCILMFVAYITSMSIKSSFMNTGLLEGQILECVWTLVPAAILIQIAVPSLALLYMMDESVSSEITVKAIGHQWYWTYEFDNLSLNKMNLSSSLDSYLDDYKEFSFRLLDVDNRMVLPYACPIRVLVTSEDVLHAWTVPSMGVKVDACPGRINQTSMLSHRPSVVYGQCSEICGANHSFMPIVVEFLSSEDYIESLI